MALAQADTLQWGAIVTALIAAVGSAIGGCYAYLGQRDKLRHDARLLVVEEENKRCCREIDRLTRDGEECRKRELALWERLIQLYNQTGHAPPPAPPGIGHGEGGGP